MAGQDLPVDPRSYEKVINLDIEEELFAVCPRCASSYPLTKDDQLSIPRCTSTTWSGSKPCGAILYQRDAIKPKNKRPVQLFRRRKLNSWLQGFLGRPGLLKTLDIAWDQTCGPPHDPSTDFWGGSFVRELKGPDGNSPITTFPDGESRLLFSLAVDWFNPFHNKIAGKNVSSGVLFISCLNLPMDVRHKQENIYLVGIMPGYKQASQINAILKALVDDLLPYWHEGVYFFGIPGIKNARLIRCALVQLICDLPAARKIAGFPGHSATYGCSICFTRTTDASAIKTISSLRTKEDHLQHACTYKRTMESSEGLIGAEKLLKMSSHGVRWSALNDLPYWDPIKCTVLDVMHLVLLGLCQIHWRRLWHADNILKTPKNVMEEGKELATPILNDFSQPVDDVPLVELPVGNEDDWLDIEEPQMPDIPSSNLESNQSTSRLLDAQKMSEVRDAWVYGSEARLKSLSIDQMLCLLMENRGVIPDTYKQKGELVELLVVCRMCLH